MEDGSANAFDSLWQRFMDHFIKETKVKDRFPGARPPRQGCERQ
jgi:hypothetical protein